MVQSVFMDGEDSIEARLERIEKMVAQLVKVLERFAPLLDKLARNPLLGMRR